LLGVLLAASATSVSKCSSSRRWAIWTEKTYRRRKTKMAR
jgi:hypothetical protein